MRYRVRNNVRKFMYRTTIEAATKVAADKGAIVEAEGCSGDWAPIGLAFDGTFYDSRKYVDAFTLLTKWHYHSRPEFGFGNISQAGAIEFPLKYCGLDNILAEAKQVQAIRRVDRNRNYYYVLTDYGRELARIIRDLFFQKTTADGVRPEEGMTIYVMVGGYVTAHVIKAVHRDKVEYLQGNDTTSARLDFVYAKAEKAQRAADLYWAS